MQFCKFCHPFPPAHNGLLLRKTERVLTCAQDVLLAFAYGTSVYSLIRRTFGESGVGTDVNSRGKIPLNGNRTWVKRSRIHHSNHQASPSHLLLQKSLRHCRGFSGSERVEPGGAHPSEDSAMRYVSVIHSISHSCPALLRKVD